MEDKSFETFLKTLIHFLNSYDYFLYLLFNKVDLKIVLKRAFNEVLFLSTSLKPAQKSLAAASLDCLCKTGANS